MCCKRINFISRINCILRNANIYLSSQNLKPLGVLSLPLDLKLKKKSTKHKKRNCNDAYRMTDQLDYFVRIGLKYEVVRNFLKTYNLSMMFLRFSIIFYKMNPGATHAKLPHFDLFSVLEN